MLLNAIYALTLFLLSPWLLLRAWRTGRYRRNVRAKLLGTSLPSDPRATIWFHGVSVGEIHLLRGVVAAFRQRHPEWRVVVSATTETGLAEAAKAFADLAVIAYPFDFTWAVRRTMRSVSPRLVVLAESELWPNFLGVARREGIPVAVINGRMSPRSARRFSRVSALARRMLFDRVSLYAMQSESYAQNLRSLGVTHVTVTGNVKYDAVLVDPGNLKTAAMRHELGIAAEDLVWVAGSTHDPEERIVLDTYRRLRSRHPRLKLILVPRSADRFAEVDRMIDEPHHRRSVGGPPAGITLIDTIGELSAVWPLATVGFTGGSLNDQRGGQSMLEPAGAGVPTLFGPHTWNFRDAVAGLLEVGGAIRVADAAELEREVDRLLSDSAARKRIGDAAAAFVAGQRGATARTLDAIDGVLCRSGFQPDPTGPVRLET